MWVLPMHNLGPAIPTCGARLIPKPMEPVMSLNRSALGHKPPPVPPPPLPAPPSDAPAPRGPSKGDEEQWRTLTKQVKAYGWIGLAATVLGSVRLVRSRLFGKRRPTSGKSRASAWATSLIEVPLASYISYVSLY